MNAKQGDSWDMTHHSPMPRPKDDDGYFEQMSKAVFLAGLNWNVIEKKWADIRRSLANFSIDAVAQFDDSDNAQAIQQVQREFGSFAKYLQAVKATGEEALLKDLHKRFAFLGESTAAIFLFSAGEEMPQTAQKIQKMHETRTH